MESILPIVGVQICFGSLLNLRSDMGVATDIKIEVWDKDTVSSDDFLGQVKLDLRGASPPLFSPFLLPHLYPDLAIDGSSMWVPLKARKDGEKVKGEICLQFSVIPLAQQQKVLPLLLLSSSSSVPHTLFR